MSGGNWKDAFRAVEEGDYNLLQFHISEGIDLNYQHPEILMTLLVTAIKNRHTQLALLLLESGADPRLESYFDQMTPLQAALKFKDDKVIKKLSELGVQANLIQKFFFHLMASG